MRRRDSEAVSGFVNFPTCRLPSSGEGGMFVRLVVIPKERPAFMQCAGGYNTIFMDESLVDDDDTVNLPQPEYPENDSHDEIMEWIKSEEERSNAVLQRHFPNFSKKTIPNPAMGEMSRFVSVPYLAIVTLGSTGWSSGDWVCRYGDLTDKGKALYDLVKELYEGTGDLYLQTWLDT